MVFADAGTDRYKSTGCRVVERYCSDVDGTHRAYEHLDARRQHLQPQQWATSLRQWKSVERIGCILVHRQRNTELSLRWQSSSGNQLQIVDQHQWAIFGRSR